MRLGNLVSVSPDIRFQAMHVLHLIFFNVFMSKELFKYLIKEDLTTLQITHPTIRCNVSHHIHQLLFSDNARPKQDYDLASYM